MSFVKNFDRLNIQGEHIKLEEGVLTRSMARAKETEIQIN
jgi:hypothetical protein